MKLHVIIQAQHIFRVLAGFQNPPLQVVDLLAARRRSAADYDPGSGRLVVTADELFQDFNCWIYRCTHYWLADTHTLSVVAIQRALTLQDRTGKKHKTTRRVSCIFLFSTATPCATGSSLTYHVPADIIKTRQGNCPQYYTGPFYPTL